ncbi:hypothetical protein TNCV_1395671 [Trichonephila clavipes]|nr:hypothetical protein TNCV_1395671 [Trichonephila clavipes]
MYMEKKEKRNWMKRLEKNDRGVKLVEAAPPTCSYNSHYPVRHGVKLCLECRIGKRGSPVFQKPMTRCLQGDRFGDHTRLG